MKREELNNHYYYEDTVMTPANHLHRVYHADEVDHLLDEKDAEIAALKAENDRLKAKLETVNELVKTSKDLYDHAIESLKATHYAESVDAGMRERRLRRALWIARAKRADDRARIFYFSDLESVLDIDGFSYDSKKKKRCKKLTARLWRIIWLKVERKCIEKAGFYL